MNQSSQASSKFDVIVVGARVAGAATAMLLARRGVRTLLVNGSPRPQPLPTRAITRGGVLQLTRWGLREPIVASGTPAVQRTTFRHGDQRATVSVKPSHGVDALFAPRSATLSQLLVAAATEAGADVAGGATVSDVVVRSGRVVGVQLTGPDGLTRKVGASVVVGADGVRSAAADSLGAAYRRIGGSPTVLTYAYWADLSVDGYEFVFRPDVRAGLIPTDNGEHCVFAAGSSQAIGRGGVRLIADVVTEAAPELGRQLRRAAAPSGVRTTAVHLGYIRRSSGPGWALVGDAGFFKDPASPHGLGDELRDAELLADAIVTGYVQGGSLDDALAGYEATRDRIATPAFDVADRIAGHDWDEAGLAHLLLELSSAMASEVDAMAELHMEELR